MGRFIFRVSVLWFLKFIKYSQSNLILKQNQKAGRVIKPHRINENNSKELKKHSNSEDDHRSRTSQTDDDDEADFDESIYDLTV